MKLDELVREFDGLEPDEKLELLIEQGDDLPPLSAGRRTAPLPAECRVQECQTPVYLWVDLEGEKVRVEADVSEKSPTVRGLVAMVVQAVDGATPAEVARFPDDILRLLGLEAALGMTRQQGIRGVVARIKRDTARAAATAHH